MNVVGWSTILPMEGVFKEMIWGGERLRELFGYRIPSDRTGEYWAISDHPEGRSRVSAGPFRGLTLGELMGSHHGLGGLGGDRFPVMVKVISPLQDLSVQVHPDDRMAREEGDWGKPEGWYVLDCPPGARIVLGHRAGDRRELEEMVRGSQWDLLLRSVEVLPGDFVFIPPGTVHALTGGVTVLEVQRTSNLTYRLYDYDRLGPDGRPRELHLERGLRAVKVPQGDLHLIRGGEAPGGRRTLWDGGPFTVEELRVSPQGLCLEVSRPLCVSVARGSGWVLGDIEVPVAAGDHLVVLPGEVKMRGAFDAVAVRV